MLVRLRRLNLECCTRAGIYEELAVVKYFFLAIYALALVLIIFSESTGPIGLSIAIAGFVIFGYLVFRATDRKR